MFHIKLKTLLFRSKMNKPLSVHDKIDIIFKEVGDFGPYQLLIILIAGALGMIDAIDAYSIGFYTTAPDHR